MLLGNINKMHSAYCTIVSWIVVFILKLSRGIADNFTNRNLANGKLDIYYYNDWG